MVAVLFATGAVGSYVQRRPVGVEREARLVATRAAVVGAVTAAAEFPWWAVGLAVCAGSGSVLTRNRKGREREWWLAERPPPAPWQTPAPFPPPSFEQPPPPPLGTWPYPLPPPSKPSPPVQPVTSQLLS